MSVAQRLYEAGHITYMRTDSVNLSETALDAAQAEIEKAYGKEFSNRTKYATKDAGAQEAHEAIRPSDFGKHTINGESEQERLYDLIWKRAISSQMSDAQLERTTIKVNAAGVDETFQAKGEVIKFEGFLKVYLESNLDDEDEDETESGLLPAVSKGDILDANEIKITQRFSRPPARYVEASLVKKLESLGIGRPSTYAPTITTIQKRGYVEKPDREGEERAYSQWKLSNNKIERVELTEVTGREKNKLAPTDIGVVVTDFLSEHFVTIMDYNFTAKIEKEFDDGFGIWLRNPNQQEDDANWDLFQSIINGMGLQWEFSSRSSTVTFMDLNIHLRRGRLFTSLYAKPMALHLYIPPTSCHAPGIATGVPPLWRATFRPDSSKAGKP